MALIDDAREAIRAYLDADPKRNIASLARKSSVAHSTLRSIMQGETKDVRQETVVAILSIFLSQREVLHLLGKHDGNWKALSERLESERFEYINSFEEEWEHPDIYLLALAHSDGFLTRERVMREYGEYGLKRLEHLRDMGFISETGNHFRSLLENVTDPSAKSVLKRIELHARHFNLENVGSGAFYRTEVEFVSSDCYEKIREHAMTYFESIFREIREDKGLKDKVMILNMMCNFLRDKEGQP
jgi:hypothetical protein